MKIQLSYDRINQINTDLLVVILDAPTNLHDLTGSPLDETVRRVAADMGSKRIKKEYFTSLDPKSPVKNLLIYTTAHNPAQNTWENLKIFVARSVLLRSMVAGDDLLQAIILRLRARDQRGGCEKSEHQKQKGAVLADGDHVFPEAVGTAIDSSTASKYDATVLARWIETAKIGDLAAGVPKFAALDA